MTSGRPMPTPTLPKFFWTVVVALAQFPPRDRRGWTLRQRSLLIPPTIRFVMLLSGGGGSSTESGDQPDVSPVAPIFTPSSHCPMAAEQAGGEGEADAAE